MAEKEEGKEAEVKPESGEAAVGNAEEGSASPVGLSTEKKKMSPIAMLVAGVFGGAIFGFAAPTLLLDSASPSKSFFESHWANHDWIGGAGHRSETHERGHGRVEDRYYYLAKVPEDVSVFGAWPGLRAIGMAIRVTEKEGKTTECSVKTKYSYLICPIMTL